MKDLRTYNSDRMRPIRTMSNKQTTECAAGGATHTIRRGESLVGIATAHALSLEDLLAANPTVNPYAYRAGTQLRIPVQRTTECCDGRLYCVQLGDTVAGIAAAFEISEADLIAANPIMLQTGLIPGQIICIPPVTELPEEPEIPEEPEEPEIPEEPEVPELCPGAADQIIITQGTVVADILSAYDISYNALQAMNPGVDLNNLMVGQTLCIPEPGTRGTCILCDTTYILTAGDTLDSLVIALGTTLSDLLEKNPTMLPSDFVEGAMVCV